MMRVRSAVVAAMLGAGLVLAGCGGQEEPKPLEGQSDAGDNAPDDAGGDQGDDTGGEEDPSDDSTPSDGGTGGADHGPAQGMDYDPVDQQTEAEVEKAALKFSAEYDKLLAGKASSVRELYTDDCKQCSEYVNNVEQTYRAGGRYDGGGYLDPRVEVRGKDGSGRVFAVLVSKSSAYKLYDGSGRVVESEPEKQDNQRYYLEEVEVGWRIVQWT